MEALLFILFAVFVAVMNADKKKKEAAKKNAANFADVAKQPQPKRGGAAKAIKAVADTTGSDFLEALSAVTEVVREIADEPATKEEPLPKVEPAATQAESDAVPVGRMTPAQRRARRAELLARRQARAQAQAQPAQTLRNGEDAEGCVGGSMAHNHDEGESRAEHGKHLEEMRLREAEEASAEAEALDLSAINAARLRQAVVMAEVLDKPRALRPRGQYGRTA